MSNTEERDSLDSFQEKPDVWTTIKEYLYIVWRGRWIVLPIFLVSLLVGAMTGLGEVPIYKAEAVIQIQMAGGGGKSGLADAMSGTAGNPALETQIEIIRSRTIAERVVRSLNLQFQVVNEQSFWDKVRGRLGTRLGKSVKQPSYTIDALDVGQIEQSMQYKLVFLDESRFLVENNQGMRIGEGRIGQPFQLKEANFVVKGVGEPNGHAVFQILTLRQAAAGVQGSISAKPVKSTDIVRIEAVDLNSGLSKDIANKVAEEYTVLMLGRKTQEALQTMEFIRNQLQPVLQNLSAAEDQLSRFKQGNGPASLSKDGSTVMTQAVETDREIQKLRLQRQETEIALETLRNSSVGDNFKWPGVTGAGNVADALSRELTSLLVRRPSLKYQLTQHHPTIRQIEGQLFRLKEQLIEELPNAIAALEAKESLLKKKYQQELSMLNGLPAQEQELARLTMQVKVNQNTYNFLLQKQEELRLASASQIANIWVIDAALPPLYSITPKASKAIYMDGGIGLLLGIFLVILWERVDKTIKVPDEVSGRMGMPCLGAIPLFEAKQVNGQLDRLVVFNESLSHAAEALRFLWTNLAFATIDRPTKILLITSSGPGEGKSTTLANLGVTAAQLGKRVLIVDLDLRRPTIHRIFQCSFSPGFTNYVLGESTFIQETAIPNLHVVTAGDRPSNPAMLLASQSLPDFFIQMSKQYDVILIDTPPLMPLADALMLGPYIDGLILLVKSRYTSLNVLRRCVASMRSLSPKILGIVINGIDEKRERYYSYSYHSYLSGDNNGERSDEPRKEGLATRLRKKLPPALAGRK